MIPSVPGPEIPAMALRPPGEVMRLDRMGSSFATRLSFMRVFIRELMQGGWRIDRPLFDVIAGGFGTALYRVSKADRSYTLVAFSHDLPPDKRTDRVIAEAWDATFVLFDGEPSPADVTRLRANAPLQEAGRFAASDLVLARANKSLRYFDHVAMRLATGQQPDEALTRAVGYLMRTTAVYGNGKFGIADRFRIAGRPELCGPFQAEMLAVYLIRLFTLDLVEHVARQRAPDAAVALAPRFRRFIGIGNATGLGMAPFLMTHPALVDRWVTARETALARARAATRFDRQRLADLVSRARRHVAEWRVEDERQSRRIAALEADLAAFAAALPTFATPDAACRWAEIHGGLEAQELVASLLIELVPELVDDLSRHMASDDPGRLDPAMTLATLRVLIDRHYGWATALDLEDPAARAQFWYVSEDKLEPRLGNRAEEEGAELERPFAIAHDIARLCADLAVAPAGESLAAFLLRHPQHRHVVRRVQVVARHPYGEICDNLVASTCHPIDLLRFKLAFFGAAKFDPKSDRWTRIAMYQGAPLPEDLATPAADDWAFPVL
jgi:hypothetical protein